MILIPEFSSCQEWSMIRNEMDSQPSPKGSDFTALAMHAAHGLKQRIRAT
jgi:hypothetical protein